MEDDEIEFAGTEDIEIKGGQGIQIENPTIAEKDTDL